MSIYLKASCARCRQRVWQVAPPGQMAAAAEPSEPEIAAAPAPAPPEVVCRRCLAEPLRPPGGGQTCAICLEAPINPVRYAAVSTHSWANHGRCTHRNCLECMRGYLKSRVAEGVWNVRCPQEGCSYRLLDHDFKRILNEEGDCAALEQYRALRSVDFRANLNSVLSAAAERKEGLEAEACEAVAGLGSPAFESWAVQECQACPVCFVLVRKEEGCNHLACRCGTEFCYGCGAPEAADPSGGELPGCLCAEQAPERLGRWLRSCGRLAPAEP